MTKTAKTIGLVLAAAILTAATASAGPPAVPATPAPVEDLLYARTFTLDKGYTFEWSKDRPLLTEGTLLVLRVDPDLVYPRQTAEPVLYVGNRTAERLNIGYRSGRVVAIVPGRVDLTTTPIWFGTAELPERVDGNIASGEKAAANAAGIKPFSAATVKAAYARGGKGLALADREGLRPHIAALLGEFSSEETDLIEQLNVPVNR